MSVPAPPHRRHPAWPRALLTLLALLLAALTATATPGAQASPRPPAALSTESGGSEIQQDATDTALRLPTGHATRVPTPRTPAAAPPRRPAAAPAPRPTLLHPHVPTPRSVVLRC
ncbi:hypothetical protein ABZ953_08440 [Streptomyces sp. NPDC046465]|uniref:hypothetical protein n=1 Tax=Streptomyces sp. NPDC046465 TaxID=3155810 RepID=UPI0033FBA85F